MKNSRIMVDSGAHSLYNQFVAPKNEYAYYETDAFWAYVDSYAAFIKENQHLIEVYVNVDAIFNPELTWKVQKYMENQHGLHPLPVVHAGTNISWFKKYMDNYNYIGIGGMAQKGAKDGWIKNLGDPVFSLICRPPNYEPTHKIHGFAITAPSLLARYPFYSVDSTSWIQFGKYGAVIIPRKKNGVYNYKESPYITFVTSREAKKGHVGHFDNFVDMHQGYFHDYFTEKGFIIGSSTFRTIDPTGYKITENEHWADRKAGLVETIIELGLSNSHELRDQLNIQFYLDLEANLPPWPWSWKPKTKTRLLF